jgi:uncharacterized protein YjdB
MTDKQYVNAGISLLDQDGQPFAALPPGMSVSFESSDPEVAPFEPGPDGMNGRVLSGKVGSAIVTARLLQDGAEVLNDTLAVAVTNSLPGALNFSVGSPQDE